MAGVLATQLPDAIARDSRARQANELAIQSHAAEVSTEGLQDQVSSVSADLVALLKANEEQAGDLADQNKTIAGLRKKVRDLKDQLAS
jgi:hypothetical protein